MKLFTRPQWIKYNWIEAKQIVWKYIQNATRVLKWSYRLVTRKYVFHVKLILYALKVGVEGVSPIPSVVMHSRVIYCFTVPLHSFEDR